MDGKGHRQGGSQNQPNTRTPLLPNHTLNYYRRVEEMLTGDMECEEKELFFNNVFIQLQGEIATVSRSQTVSPIIQKLLHAAKPIHIANLLSEFRKDWESAHERCISHVLQTVIALSPKCHEAVSDDELSVQDMVLEYCSYVEENLEYLLIDTYGSHILRVLLEVLGGVDVSPDIIRGRVSKQKPNRFTDDKTLQLPDKSNPPEIYAKRFRRLVKKIFSVCNFTGHFHDSNSCPVFQTILIIMREKNPSKCYKYVKQILQKIGIHEEKTSGADHGALPRAVKDEIMSYLLEQIVSICLSEGKARQLYDSLFKGKILNFAVDKIANYVLQRLLDSVTDEDMFKDVFDELKDHIEDILAVQHFAIVYKLAQACTRNGILEVEFIEVLMKGFHCMSPKSRRLMLVPLVLSLSTYEVYFKVDSDSEQEDVQVSSHLTHVNYHGSVLLQTILKFRKTEKIVASFLHLKPSDLKLLSCDRFGSHVIDTFFLSETVNEEKKSLFIKKMKESEGCLLDLCCDCYGSRSVEAMWKGCSVPQKVLLAEDLAKHLHKIRDNRFGTHIIRNFRIEEFIYRRNDWVAFHGSINKKRYIFEDLLHDSGIHSEPKTKQSKLEDQTEEPRVKRVGPRTKIKPTANRR